MYKQFKQDFMMRLVNDFNSDEINKILLQLDIVSTNYSINRETYEMMLYESGLPRVCEIYLADIELRGFSKGTIKGYRYQLLNFFEEIKLPPNKVESNHIRAYLYNYQKNHNICNASLERIRLAIHVFYEWMVNEEYISKNPCKKVEKIRYERKQKHALKPIELEYLRQACVTLREKAIIEFFYSTGCRVGELVIVKKDDVDWNTKEVHLFGKGKKHRTSYLNAKCELALKDYLLSRDDDNEYLFVSERKPHGKLSVSGVEKIVREIVNRKGLKTHCTPHIFRHTTATTALKNGMQLEEIQRLLGHENVSTTLCYAELDQSKVKLDHSKYIV